MWFVEIINKVTIRTHFIDRTSPEIENTCALQYTFFTSSFLTAEKRGARSRGAAVN
jgi:hypothetical protein